MQRIYIISTQLSSDFLHPSAGPSNIIDDPHNVNAEINSASVDMNNMFAVSLIF